MLIVEPDPVSATELKRVCTDSGYQVTAVPNGSAGLEKVRKAAARGQAGGSGQYELVLCDVELPDMPGREVLLEIREILGNNVRQFLAPPPHPSTSTPTPIPPQPYRPTLCGR